MYVRQAKIWCNHRVNIGVKGNGEVFLWKAGTASSLLLLCHHHFRDPPSIVRFSISICCVHGQVVDCSSSPLVSTLFLLRSLCPFWVQRQSSVSDEPGAKC